MTTRFTVNHVREDTQTTYAIHKEYNNGNSWPRKWKSINTFLPF